MMSKKIWLNIVYCIYCGHKTEYNSKYHHYDSKIYYEYRIQTFPFLVRQPVVFTFHCWNLAETCARLTVGEFSSSSFWVS